MYLSSMKPSNNEKSLLPQSCNIIWSFDITNLRSLLPGPLHALFGHLTHIT